MTNKTDKRGFGRMLRLSTAALISATVVTGSTLAVVATPAFAATPMGIEIDGLGVMVGGGSGAGANDITGPDFSYTSTGVPMARNVGVTVIGMAPNSTVSFAWRDESSGGSWQQGPTTSVETAWSPGFYEASAEITDIPSSTCGQTLQIEATGQTGVWVPPALPNYSTLYTVTTSADAVTETCGPEIWTTASNGSVTGFAGDGFTPGGQVVVSGTGPVLSPLQCFTLMGRRTCVAPLWTETVTATTTQFGLLCPGLRLGACSSFVLRGGGEISVTFPTPIPECVGNPNTFLAVDLSSGLSASGTAGGICLE